MKIYVASSWRNEFQPTVVAALREDGHEVYDFKDSEGFHWSEVDPNWRNWTPDEYVAGLQHHCANRGYGRDMEALCAADATVMVMPCGLSAGIEFGYATGSGQQVAVYIPALREPDLMIKMAALVTASLEDIRAWALSLRDAGITREARNATN